MTKLQGNIKDWQSECITQRITQSQYLISKSASCRWGKDKKCPISREEDAGEMISVHVASDRRVPWQQTRLMVPRAVLTAALPVEQVRGLTLLLFSQHFLDHI